jgi:hypothetical protein
LAASIAKTAAVVATAAAVEAAAATTAPTAVEAVANVAAAVILSLLLGSMTVIRVFGGQYTKVY